MNLKKPAAKSKDKSTPQKRVAATRPQSKAFPVVGIGASAGGLEAFKQLLAHLPVDTGMAFVLAQHLDPTRDSILTELLSRSSRMPVSEVRDGMAVAPDHVYVVPPNTNMAISGGVLRLLPRENTRGRHRPIDYFLRTLAEDRSHRAIGVILSGTASDGTLGLGAIKAEGGITFAEDLKSAKYDSMPRSAIAAGHVDFILTPEDIAQELTRISRHPYVTPPGATATHGEEEIQSIGRNGFRNILESLRKATGVDFTDYKANTLHRRITRRMALNKLERMEDYTHLLRENAAEVDALHQDILISVTSFFRNPESFGVLKERIFPKIVEHREPDEPVRIWSLGCSTGEEAYSIAMSFVEFAGDQAEHIPVQIFATDISDKGIEKARAGLYSKDIAEDVSPERLRRFFTEAEDGYRISKPIRDMVVFARQNVLADPPFSRMDLISCRNLLIYLEAVLQKQALRALHYALKPAGVLWLGASETVGAASDLFTPVDKKRHFYAKKLTSTRPRLHSAPGDATHDRAGFGRKTNRATEPAPGGHDAEKEADRILLSRYSPASVLINPEMEILQFRGSTGSYLEAPAGRTTLNLLKMAREGLMLPLRAAIQKVKKDDVTVKKEGVRFNGDGESHRVNLEVVPIKGLAAPERCFLVLFEPPPPQNLGQEIGPREEKAGRTKRKTEDHQVARLQEELAATREYMQSLVEQQEAANEELQSSSEEAQSSNEELQSINEELETSKEELESSNEELTALNDELRNRNLDLTVLNDDLNNLHVSVNIPLLMLGRDLRIRRFTPQAEKILSLISTDVGRPIGDIKFKINVPDLEAMIVEVIDTGGAKEIEAQDAEGRWYSMRVRPYKTLDNKIDGAVIALVNIDANKRSEAAIQEARDYAESIIRTTRDPLLILNADLRVHTANEAFYSMFNVGPAESEGRSIYDLCNGQWNIPRLRELLEDILPCNSFFDNFEVTQDFKSIGRRTMLLNARRLSDAIGQPARILLGIQDVTELLHFQTGMRRSEQRYRRLFEASRDGVLLIDPVTRKILDANPFMTELLNYTREELLGKELFEIGLLEDEAASLAVFRELKGKGFIRCDDLPLETKTGERRVVEFVSNLYHEYGDEIVQCNIRDVTERKQAEDARQTLTEQLAAELTATRQLQETSARLIQEGDINALYQRILEAAMAIMRSDMASMQMIDEGEDALRLLAHRGFDPAFAQTFELARPDTRTSCSVARRVGHRVVVPDVETCDFIVGTTALEDHRKTGIRAAQSTPLISRSGDLLGMISTHWREPHQPAERELRLIDVLARQAADIIERALAEEALRQSEEKFKLLFERSPLPKWAFDLETLRFIDVNEAAVKHYGYSREEFLRMSALDTLTPEGSEAFQAAIVRRPRRLPESETCRHRKKNGEVIDVEVRFGEISLAGKRVGLASIDDITERKQAEEERERLLASEQQSRQEAEEANRVKDEFLATVSHELRSPLNAILGWSSMLLGGRLDELAVMNAIEIIARNARAQNQLIADLLDVSRIISGKLHFTMEAVDLIAVIEAALETVRPAAEAKGVELRTMLDPAAGMVSGDTVRLQQVVWNLLANAIKYTPRGGRVETRLEREGAHAAIIVRDTGEGISADLLPHIFDRFRQADGTTTRQHGGLGLGLAIVRHLVEAHGGQVRAVSEGAGQGSTFTVTLPLMALRTADVGSRNDAAVYGQSSLLTGLRILVVDDELDVRDLLRASLTQVGAEVRTGATAREALDILGQWQPHVLVSDIGMPEVDGYGLIRQVRALPAERGGRIPAMALTAYASDKDAARALEAGYHIFASKPVDLAELAAAIARLAVIG